MFEKPQYLTPDGYRRTPKNPFKSGIPFKEAVQRLADADKTKTPVPKVPATKAGTDPLKIKPHVAHFLKLKQVGVLKKQPVISEKAALLIAEAIRNLLKSK
jgi:hypothetical protein